MSSASTSAQPNRYETRHIGVFFSVAVDYFIDTETSRPSGFQMTDAVTGKLLRLCFIDDAAPLFDVPRQDAGGLTTAINATSGLSDLVGEAVCGPQDFMEIDVDCIECRGHAITVAFNFKTRRVLALELGEPTSEPLLERLFSTAVSRMTR